MDDIDQKLLQLVQRRAVYREMVEATGLKSTSAVSYRLSNLADAGLITASDGKARTRELTIEGLKALRYPDDYQATNSRGPWRPYSEKDEEAVRKSAGIAHPAMIGAAIGRSESSVRSWARRNDVDLSLDPKS